MLDALASHPRLAERLLILPGNHDLNIVDRANPARLDLPTSPNRKLRRLRFLSAVDALHGERVHLIDHRGRCLAGTLSAALKPHRAEMARFADLGKPRLSGGLDELWSTVFPMVLPPKQDDGLGIILLNSNADTHFSFTNALGMISVEQVRGIHIAAAQYPRASWIVALHHHVVEYPTMSKAAVRTDRHGSGERKLVHSAPEGAGRPRRADARSPAHRLDRTMRGPFDHFGTITRDGRHGRLRHLFLHPQFGAEGRRRPGHVSPRAGRCGRRSDAQLNAAFPRPSFIRWPTPARYPFSVPGSRSLYGDDAGREAIQTDASRDEDGAEHNRFDDRKCSLFLLKPGHNKQCRSGPI